jgi:hypothetical protein
MEDNIVENKLDKPVFVSAGYPAAMRHLFPNAVDGAWVFEDHGDKKGLRLAFWGLEAAIPTDAEVAAAISAVEAGAPAIARKVAYQAESDALVIRAVRLQLAGDPGADAAKDEALAKVAEIKARIPDLEAK